MRGAQFAGEYVYQAVEYLVYNSSTGKPWRDLDVKARIAKVTELGIESAYSGLSDRIRSLSTFHTRSDFRIRERLEQGKSLGCFSMVQMAEFTDIKILTRVKTVLKKRSSLSRIVLPTASKEWRRFAVLVMYYW